MNTDYNWFALYGDKKKKKAIVGWEGTSGFILEKGGKIIKAEGANFVGYVTEPKIKQLAPADGWEAVYDGDEVEREPLLYWGLMTDGTVKGFVNDMEDATEIDGFDRFEAIGYSEGADFNEYPMDNWLE